jgi:hypothetical protein
MFNLFIGLTPLHIITAICSDKRKSEDLVVLVDQNGSLHDFYEAVCRSALLKNFQYIDSSCSWQKLFSFLLDARNPFPTSFEIKIRQLVDKNFESVYVFNDLAPEVQFILSRIDFSAAHYIEDGSAAYNSHFVDRKIYKKIIINFMFSRFYDPINVIGTSKYISHGFYSYPENVRSENRLKAVKKLCFRNDFRKCLRVLSDCYKGALKRADDERAKCVIFVPKDQDVCVQRLIKCAQEIAGKMGVYNVKIILKFHPLSDPKLENEFRGDKSITLCPRGMPGELLPEIYENVVLVLGEGSTILMNLRRFYGYIKVFNITKMFPDVYDKFLSDIGVLNLEC